MIPKEHYSHEIPGWFDFQGLYKEVIQTVPDGGVLVEVGVWRGKSLCFLLVEAFNSGKKLRICGVDHWRGSVGEPALVHEASQVDLSIACMMNCQRSGYPSELFRADSTDAAEQFADGSVDFVFLDGSHDFESVDADIRAWLPKMKAGGMLAGHDRHYPTVKRAVDSHLPGSRINGTCWTWVKPAVSKKEKQHAKAS